MRASQDAWIVWTTPPPGHYERGAVGLHRRLPKGAPTSGVGPDGGLANKPLEEPRGAPGDWHLKKHCEPVPGVLLPCSLIVRRPLPGNARGITRATSPGGRGRVAPEGATG